MAVISVTTLNVKPDKYDKFLEQNRQAKAILERCGATNVRLIGTIVAGEASGTLAKSWEAADNASYGAVMDKFLADPEGMAVLMQSNSADGPISGFQSSIWGDIEL
jgi:hypothetical protein